MLDMLSIRGDILVMWASKHNINTVVNMCNHDTVVANFVAEGIYPSVY